MTAGYSGFDSPINREFLEEKGYLASVMVSGAPYPYSCENMAMYIQGSAGSGKSQVIKQMIHDIRRRGGRDKLVIYDRKPEYLPIFFQSGDKIICPADIRHTPWDIFAEVKSPADITGVISSLFPSLNETANDKFWNDSARDIFRACLLYCMNKEAEPHNYDLCKLLFTYSSDPKALWMKLKTDKAAAMYASGALKGTENERSSGNVSSSAIATLKSYTNSFTLPEVAERGNFSVKEWLRDTSTEGQALFLVNPMKYASNYKSYYTVIIDLMLREMVSLPNDQNRRVWFFLDEFGSLHQLDSIVRLLAEGRSKGAGTVVGTQDIAQIKQSYKDLVDTILNNCNSKVFAKISSYDEADKLSKYLGEAEIGSEPDESTMQFDKNGFNISLRGEEKTIKRERRSVVMPSELMNLESLTYYSKFGNHDFFLNKIAYYPWDSHEIVPDFIERPPEFFDPTRLVDDEPEGNLTRRDY